MHCAALWFGFLGAWLLVAGPIYQASIELQSEDVELDRIRAATADIPSPPRVSIWWWLLPPVRMLLTRRRRKRHQRDIVDRMSDEDLFAFTSLRNKSLGWMLVALGGFLIAAKETYELAEGLEWPMWVVPVLVVVMFAFAVSLTIAQNRRDHEMTERRRIR
ncbi:hypothetical protein [Antrihabitans cavernicola]|uniref:Uncharacterized protein n=1 Tax=Antrihabitans cavernicola TaxID=2495913 RepID=A0A5A7SFH7_9NOCA|nr:hypothetical protein [Spelaeibacter cavernicola]KAA0023437.1 hypothetical protein FOY51_08490 [Spelaeibacter cavernicola]